MIQCNIQMIQKGLISVKVRAALRATCIRANVDMFAVINAKMWPLFNSMVPICLLCFHLARSS